MISMTNGTRKQVVQELNAEFETKLKKKTITISCRQHYKTQNKTPCVTALMTIV